MRYHIPALAIALFAVLPGSGGADSNPEPLLESLTPLYPAPEVATASGGDAAPQPDGEIRELFAGIRRLIGKRLATIAAAATPQQRKQPGNPGLEVVMDPLGTPAFISVSRPQPLGAASAANPPDRSSLLQEAGDFLARHRSLLKLEEPARELRLTRLYRDSRGYSHLRYSQSYRGIPVWGAGLILHLDERGAVSSMDGKYIPSPAGLQPTPRIDSTRAVAVARRALDLPAGLDLPSSATLVIHADGNGRPPVLAWQVTLEISLARRMVTLVDAASARPIFSYNAARGISVAGSGQDTLGNIRSFNVWKEREGEYHLIDTVRMGATIDDPVTGDTPKGVIRILDARNGEQDLFPVVSRSATGGWLREGVNAAFNISAAYDYFLDKHQRNSLDGEGGSITAIVRVGEDVTNAHFLPDRGWLAFGDGDNVSGSLDIVAHEYTHGITSNSSGLIYLNQSGALDEALSDIFGEVVEHATFGSNDWILGSQMQDPGLTRNMKQPATLEWSPGKPYPTRMSEYVALPLEDDNGGVHVNSSIINRAFYLLAEGMDNAIGIVPAAQIFYRANTVHLLPRSGFADMRRAAIQAAQELYPAKAALVTAAFDAVEIFDTAPPSRPSPTRAIDAEDAVITVISDGENRYLGRRDGSQGDPDAGVRLTSTPVQPMRPAVSADGSLVLFISEKHDLCKTSADRSIGEECLGKPGSFHSIAISADARFFAFVPRDPATGKASSTICLMDALNQSDSAVYPLLPADLDGFLSNTVAYADAMGFTADNRLLLFDALNRATLTSGQRMDIWSIYALELASGSIVPVLPPMPMAATAYPSPSSVDPYLVTFEAFDATTNQIYVGNLLTGELVVVAETETHAIPALNGDDSAVIYTRLESSEQGYYPYLYRQEIDGLAPTGEPTRWLAGGAAGVIYRSGEFVPMSRADIQVTQTVERKDAATGEDVVFVVTLLNRGPDSATGLTVNSYFPRQLEPHTLPDGCLRAENSAAISCALPDLHPKQENTIRLTYRATARGEYSHRADAASDVEDPDKLNNMSFASVTVSDRQQGSIPQNETHKRAGNGDNGRGGGGAVLPLLSLLFAWLVLHHGGNRQQLCG